MPKVGSVLQFVGGAIGRTAASGLVIGFFFVVVGMLPWQAAALIYENPPTWMEAIWFRLGVLILGLVVIGASLHFNVWSKKQQVIDSLAEDIAWAIQNLLNRNPPPTTSAEIDKWQADFNDWCGESAGNWKIERSSRVQINYILTCWDLLTGSR